MKLYPLSVDVLYDGMLVDFGIYFSYKGKMILLCRDLVLNRSKIESIKATMSFCKNIYVDKLNHEKIMKDTEYFSKAQAKLENFIGYDSMKNLQQIILTDAAGGFINKDAADALSRTVGEKLEDIESALILQCINGVRELDEYLYVHCLNVGLLNGMISRWAHLDDEKIVRMIKAGLIHDIGKLKISPDILNKPGKLTKLEYEAVKRHPKFGYDMLIKSGERDPEILDGVLHHHERVNGTGYPDGEQSISQVARITAISDVYDAMTAKRPYKEEFTPFQILQELSDNSFSDLDMKYVQLFLQNMPRELTGHTVLLSNGAVAKVEFVDPSHPKYPIVSVDGDVVQTNDKLYCKKMCVD